jgi:RNA polymerase sigma-70 factor, ECF subfamily
MRKMDINSIVRLHGKKVYNLAYRITGNHHDAEDVTQEAFLQVHGNLPKFRGESLISTWLYRITVNTSLQIKRNLNKAYIDSLDETILQFKDDIPEDVKRWEDDPETRYIYDELLAEVQRACCHFITFRLTDEQRVVYIMRAMFNFPLDDIAAVLEINKNTIKARLQRAKTSLGTYFSGRCQWIEGGDGCSCESRLGFALSYAPEILQRLRNQPPDKNMKAVMRNAFEDIRNLDQFYRNLPAEKYDLDVLEKYLKMA